MAKSKLPLTEDLGFSWTSQLYLVCGAESDDNGDRDNLDQMVRARSPAEAFLIWLDFQVREWIRMQGVNGYDSFDDNTRLELQIRHLVRTRVKELASCLTMLFSLPKDTHGMTGVLGWHNGECYEVSTDLGVLHLVRRDQPESKINSWFNCWRQLLLDNWGGQNAWDKFNEYAKFNESELHQKQGETT